MTTNTLAAIRERADEYAAVVNEWMHAQAGSDEYFLLGVRIEEMEGQAVDDRAALLAIVDELTRKLEAAEAALEAERGLNAAYKTVIDEYAQYVDELTASKRYPVPFRDFMEWRMGEIKKQAADALAAHDANGESAGNGGA